MIDNEKRELLAGSFNSSLSRSSGFDATHRAFCKSFPILLVTFGLYFAQGLCFDFWAESMTLLLIEEGVKADSVAFFALIVVPFSLKFLWSPLLDHHSGDSFHRHKLVVVYSMYAFGAIHLAFSLIMDDALRHQHVSYLFAAGLASHFILGLQGVSLDSWIIFLIPRCHYSYAASAKFMGITLGGLISYQVYIMFSKFTIFGIRIFSPANFIAGVGCFSVILALIIHLMVVDRRKISKDQPAETVTAVIKATGDQSPESDVPEPIPLLSVVKGFLAHPGLRVLVIFITCNKLGYAAVECGSFYVLIPKGFKKENFAFVDSVKTPFKLLISACLGKILTRYSELNVMIFAQGVKLLESVFAFFIYTSYQGDESRESTITLLCVQGLLSTIVTTSTFIGFTTFAQKITDKKVSASYLALLTGCMNIGKDLPQSLGFYLVHHFQFDYLAFAGWLYSVAFMLFIGSKLLHLQDLPRRSWRLSNTVEIPEATKSDESPQQQPIEKALLSA